MQIWIQLSSGHKHRCDSSLARHVCCRCNGLSRLVPYYSRTYRSVLSRRFFSQKKTTVADAARLGQQAIRDKYEQITRYGMSVRVHDDNVPFHYKNNGHTLRKFWAKPADGTRDIAVLAELEKLEDEIVGRENNILLLEQNLQLESDIGVLSGRARNGKICLMELLGLCWRMTNFIAGTLWFDAVTIGKQQVLVYLREAFHHDFGISLEVALDTPFRKRCLIIFDSRESLERPEGSSLSKERTNLRHFLTASHGGRSLVLMSSRRSEGWLSKLGSHINRHRRWKETFSEVLEGPTPIYGVQPVGSLLNNLRESESIMTEEDRSYMERLVKLAEGNPLVIQILSYDFSKTMTSTVEYYNGLLDCAQIGFKDGWLESEEGTRSAVELRNINQDLLMRSDALAGDWFEVGICVAAGETLSLRDYCHAIPLTFYTFT